MGTVYVPIPTADSHNTSVTKWYPVEKGEGKHFCDDARGDLLVEVLVISHLANEMDKSEPRLIKDKDQ